MITALWQKGDVAACKAENEGSSPSSASKSPNVRAMFEYTKDNYFQWGLEPNRLWFDLSAASKLTLRPQTYRDEAIRAVWDIRDRAERPITLFMSGGIDSEVMLLTCLDAGLSFDVTTIVFDHGLNQYEVDIAKALCERWGIEHRLIPVDPFKLWYNPPTWMEPYKLESGLLYLMLEGIGQSWNRFQLFAGNPLIGVQRDDPKNPYMGLRKSMLFHMMAWADRDHPSVSFFHMYRPEQMWHWLNSPLIRAWAAQVEGSQIYDFDQIKALFYRMEYPEIAFSRPKWTGEERLRKHIADLYDNQWAAYRPYNPIARRPLVEVRREFGNEPH